MQSAYVWNISVCSFVSFLIGDISVVSFTFKSDVRVSDLTRRISLKNGKFREEKCLDRQIEHVNITEYLIEIFTANMKLSLLGN